MASHGETTLPATRRTRKSVGASPTRRLRDGENATVDLGTTLGASRKKSRSKSMGPGSLDALKVGNGNRRASLAVPSRPPPRSILKPTMPLLPDIPPHRPRTTTRSPDAVATTNASNQSNGDDNSGTKIALRTEEEQQAAAREREERERAQMEKDVKDRREARRKSLANRRVSFAAEATLHTFHEVEYMQDSTASSDAARQASHANQKPDTPDASAPDALESSASAGVEEQGMEMILPPQQQQSNGRRRRSSGNFSEADDVTLASTVFSDDSERGDDIQSVQGEILSGSDDSDEDDGTMMTVEAEEMTTASIASRGDFSPGSSSDLDENLRTAAQHATMAGLEDDEEIIAGFAGWGKKASTQPPVRHEELAAPEEMEDAGMEMDMDDDMDMDITTAIGGIMKSSDKLPENPGSDDMSMDVTRALGGILPQPNQPARRKSVRTTSAQQDEPTTLGEQTMEFTTAIGVIKPSRVSEVSQMDFDDNEDMSMELTTAMGAVFPGRSAASASARRQTQTREESDESPMDMDMTMDMTMGLGKILPGAQTAQAKENDDDDDDDDDEMMDMDMTMAVGGILTSQTPAQSRSTAKKIMEKEVDKPDASGSVLLDLSSPFKEASPVAAQEIPEVVTAQEEAPVSSPMRAVSPAKTPERVAFPSRATTPKATEPSPTRAKTPTKTPTKAQETPSMIGSRSASPARHRSPTGRSTPRSATKAKTPQSSVFRQDPNTGAATPRVVLSPQRRTPQSRRISGVGVDRTGLGSPRVAAIMERRGSIGDAASLFVPGRRTVAFADPRAMEQEVDRERRYEKDKEDGRRILEREADGSPSEKEATLNLREMIQNLSPKKPLRGRKSLHVGSARGVLGKRPAELDDEMESEDNDGMKRLRGHPGSPVKNIRLGAPPSKNETTTGRKTRASTRGDEEETTSTPTISGTPAKIASPTHQGRFRDDVNDEPTVMPLQSSPLKDPESQEPDSEERMHLQDFLNMTSIRFMELTTTKRRHTIVPSAARDSTFAVGKDDLSLEKCVVAGACTVPMLELFQHSCRELKKYISEGRRIVREIETETFEENPPLFREYMTATPEFRVLMDNQFKNVKTHARLLSKAMWYEWRMKLQDGLREGLVKISEDMTADEKLLDEQSDLLSDVLPAMIEYLDKLQEEHDNLDAAARELADCDPEELQAAREELVAAEEDIEVKSRKIAQLRKQLEDDEAAVERLIQQKQDCLEEIQEAEKVREECRGWSTTEITALRARVDELEKQHGWAITGIQGTTISMVYRREIELVFDMAAFQPNAAQNSPIDLWYIADHRERNPIPATPEKDFVLQCTRDAVRGLSQSQTSVKELLGIVGAAWNKAQALARQVRLLNVTFPTQVNRTSDSSIAVQAALVLAPLRSKVTVSFALQSAPAGRDVDFAVSPHADVVYGEPFNTAKMTDFLVKKVSPGLAVAAARGEAAAESWGMLVAELHTKLLAKGKK